DGFVWATSPTGDVWRIDFRNRIELDAPVTRFGPEHGLRSIRRRDEALLIELGGDLVVSSASVMLSYVPDDARYTPVLRIEGIDTTRFGATAAARDDRGFWWLRLGPPGRRIVRLAPATDGGARAEEFPAAPLAELVSNA